MFGIRIRIRGASPGLVASGGITYLDAGKVDGGERAFAGNLSDALCADNRRDAGAIFRSLAGDGLSSRTGEKRETVVRSRILVCPRTHICSHASIRSQDTASPVTTVYGLSAVHAPVEDPLSAVTRPAEAASPDRSGRHRVRLYFEPLATQRSGRVEVHYTFGPTLWGPAFVAFTERGVCFLGWPKPLSRR